jgi:hypothetical protein
MRVLSLLFIILSISPGVPQTTAAEENSQQKLDKILKKAGVYCERLEKSALDYVCIEEVTEVTLHKKMEHDHARQGVKTRVYRKKKSYRYDYQLIRKNRRINENRTLIEKNGKKCRIENAELETEFINYANEMFGPVGLLCQQRQSLYTYKILKSEKSNQGRVVIIEAIHKNPSHRDSLSGEIWLKEGDYSITWIDWHQTSIGNFPAIRKLARQRGEEPLITVSSEFTVEKNGLRFPGKTSTEIAFVNEKGKKDVRVKATVEYTQYKFFTVETEIDF